MSGLPPLARAGAAPRRLVAVVLAVVALALLCRAPALSGGFVNYDDPQVREEAAAKGPLAILTEPFYFAWKPVYGLAMRLDHALFGDAAFGWHLLPWLLFAVAAGLAALLVHAWTGNVLLAAAAAALLAAHPVHTESVAWVAGTKDALSLVLVLLAHLAHRRCRARNPGSVPLLAPLLFALGGLAKGTVWTWVGVVAIDEALARPRVPGAWRRLLPWGLVAVAGVVTDAWISRVAGPGSVAHDATTLELAAAMAAVHARYLASLVWPARLSVDYPVDPAGSWASPWSIAGLLLALLAVAGLVRGVLRKDRTLAIASGLWILGLAPVNNLWPTTSVLRADRYLLVPAVGVYLLAAAALLRLSTAGRVALVAVVVLLAALSARRATVWADSGTLWTSAIEAQPATAVARVNRGTFFAERGRWAEAERDAEAGARAAVALRRPELELRARLLRATALVALPGRVEEALAEANAALALARDVTRTPWVRGDPAEVRGAAHAARGQALETRARAASDARAASEDFAAARAAYAEAVAADPGSFDGWRNLGNLLVVGGEAGLEEGARALRKAAALRPDDADTAAFLVRVLYRQGKPAEAHRLYEETSRRLGAPRVLRKAYARLTSEVGEAEEAERLRAALLAEDGADGETRALLAAHRRRRGTERLAEARTSGDLEKARAAVEAFDGAVEAFPDDVEAHVGAGDALLLLSRFADARDRYGLARRAAPDQRWLRSLEARAGALAAAWMSHLGRSEDAARAFATVVRLSPPRVDLGYQALEAEIGWLVPAANAIEAPGEGGLERALGVACLEGAALLVGGDEDGARDVLARGAALLGAPPPVDSALGRLHDACHLLLGVVRGRRADVAGARNELEPVARRRPGDPVVAFHLLLLDRLEATARRRIAEGAADAEGLAAATAKVEVVSLAADALSKSGPPWPGPGLLASETDNERGDFVAALQRLAALSERFPDAASVPRGVAAIYQAQSLRGGDRTTLLGEAQRALMKAKALDPRDPRTALDMSQLYRISGHLDAALVHAMSAASVEPIPGPASRALAAILVEKGRQALEARDAAWALSLAASAAKADPGAAGPHLLEGDAWTATQDLDRALAAFRAARDRDPVGAETAHALAECHRRRGGVYFLWRQKYPRPRGKDGAPPDPAALAEWEAKNLLAMRQAVAEFEEVLRIEPDHPEAEVVRGHVERLKALDPEAVAKSAAEARTAYEAGEASRRDGRLVEALERYREAVRRWPEHFPAWMRIAETSVALGDAHDVEGLRAVERLRDLDPERQYPEPELYSGEIWHRQWKAESSRPGREAAAAEAAARARRSLERFLESADPASTRGAAQIARARRLLDALPEPR